MLYYVALLLVALTLVEVAAGGFVQVPGETTESLHGRWPGHSGACRRWSLGDEGYQLRRLTTRRAKFFHRARDDLLTQASSWFPLAACPATGWSIRLLNVSAIADTEGTRKAGEQQLAALAREILTSSALLDTLSSHLGLFGLFAFAGRRKAQKRRATAPSDLSPVIWDDFTELSHWSPLQSALWKAIRTRRPLPLSASLVQLANVGRDHNSQLQRAVSLLVSSQEIRLRSGEILSSSEIYAEVSELVQLATHLLSAWSSSVMLHEMVKGLRDWPVIQLLADLEVPDLAELQAMGRQLHSNQLVRFLPSPQVVPSVVLPYREPLSDHDREIGRFHCTTDFFAEVEFWLQQEGRKPSARMRVVEVACWLPDCLLWAGHRLSGRLTAACLEADDLAVTAGRRSIKLNGFEGQVQVLQRRITTSPQSVEWHCRDHNDMQTDDNIENNVHLSNDRRCWFREAQGVNAKNDPLARSVDEEVSRLGFREIDILKLSFSSVDLLRSAASTLAFTRRVLLATDPRDTMAQVKLLKLAGFEEINIPPPDDWSAEPSPYTNYVIARRSG
ncbi:unnamed protein product [Symbiodinium microadriaticum]|nr:unnamed protein product [Symbiodinium microadriaticum]CAE7946797.1 unnamed protein product [Symbiodinium sp. KB8]